MPTSVDQWEWGCGFYPGEGSSGGTGATFEAARAAFEAAWRTLPADADRRPTAKLGGTSVTGQRGSTLCRMPSSVCRRSARTEGRAASTVRRSISECCVYTSAKLISAGARHKVNCCARHDCFGKWREGNGAGICGPGPFRVPLMWGIRRQPTTRWRPKALLRKRSQIGEQCLPRNVAAKAMF